MDTDKRGDGTVDSGSVLMSGPVRIQLKRVKGFNLQAVSLALNGLPAVKVTRPGKFGNPFKIGMWLDPVGGDKFQVRDAAHAVALFKSQFYPCPAVERAIAEIKAELRGKNLACFCRLDEFCHGDVLLKIANAPSPSTAAASRG